MYKLCISILSIWLVQSGFEICGILTSILMIPEFSFGYQMLRPWYPNWIPSNSLLYINIILISVHIICNVDKIE